MHAGQLVFTQFLEFLPRWRFRQIVARYQGNRRVRCFSCLDQFIVMAYAQLTSRESLRDVQTCLRAMGPKLYHVGLKGSVCRSTLADANEQRDFRIWADLAAELITQARALYAGDALALRLKDSVYAFDTTTIDLCLTLFPWCQFRRAKSAVKLHVQLDLRGHIPCFVAITGGATHEVNLLDELPLEPGSYYLLDRGFVDFARLYRFTKEHAFFVTRAKENLDFRVRESRPVDAALGLRADQSIRLSGPFSRKRYPDLLRRVSFVSPEDGRQLVFLSNNFLLAASTICRLYQSRWQVELFFKWIKQYLRIKAFLGNSANAVKTQVWIALCVYLMVAIIRRRLNVRLTMGEMLQILSAVVFEKTPILQAFSCTESNTDNLKEHNPLPLWDF